MTLHPASKWDLTEAERLWAAKRDAASELYEALVATRRAFCAVEFNAEQLAAYNAGSEAILKVRGDA